MSDFVSRLAARAVRLAAPAAPQTHGLEVDDEVVATDVPSASRPVLGAASRPKQATLARAELEPSPPARGGDPIVAKHRPPSPVAPAAEPLAAALPLAATTSGDAVIAVTTTPPLDRAVDVSAPVEDHHDVVVARPVVMTSAPAAAPMWSGVTASPPRGRESATEAAASSPGVRVHIGRLDVRAAPPQPVPVPSAPSDREAPELTLTAYLRGDRRPS